MFLSVALLTLFCLTKLSWLLLSFRVLRNLCVALMLGRL